LQRSPDSPHPTSSSACVWIRHATPTATKVPRRRFTAQRRQATAATRCSLPARFSPLAAPQLDCRHRPLPVKFPQSGLRPALRPPPVLRPLVVLRADSCPRAPSPPSPSAGYHPDGSPAAGRVRGARMSPRPILLPRQAPAAAQPAPLCPGIAREKSTVSKRCFKV
jgi:hypothetical protein